MSKLLNKIKAHIQSGKIYRIVYIGDSIASTEWIHPNWREIIEYVIKSHLDKKLNDWKTPSWQIRTINSGLDGSTSKDILKRMEDYVFTYNPQLVISIFGGNDVHANISPKQYKQNTQQIIDGISLNVDDYIFCGNTPNISTKYDQDFIPYYQQHEHLKFPPNVSYIDLFSLFQQFPLDKLFTLKSDGNQQLKLKPGDIDYTHPNQLGNAYIAKVILEKAYSINFDPDLYIKDTSDDMLSPRY